MGGQRTLPFTPVVTPGTGRVLVSGYSGSKMCTQNSSSMQQTKEQGGWLGGVYHLLRSAVGMAHVLRSGLVMGYTTSYLPYSEIDQIHLGIEPSVSPPFYPWVTATPLPVYYGSKWARFSQPLAEKGELPFGGTIFWSNPALLPQ